MTERFYAMLRATSPVLVALADTLPVGTGLVTITGQGDGTVHQQSSLELEETARVLAQALRGTLAALALAEHAVGEQMASSPFLRRHTDL